MTDITTKSFGSTDQAASWLLHLSGVPLATGARVGFGQTTVTGTGAALTETMLWLDSTGVGVINYSSPTFRHTIISNASANRTLTLGDANVTIIGYAGTLYPETIQTSSADATATTTTPVVLPGISFTPTVSSVYEFEGTIMVTSSNVTNGPQIKLTGPAEVTWVTMSMRMPGSTTATEVVQYANGWGVAIPASNIPVIGTAYPVHVKGAFRTTSSTPTSAVQAWVLSEASVSVAALKGSIMKFKRVG